ncbi:hypothetical protein AYO40_03515 [Planctomycetaceae bacterium SCGC AG-212-D15]|nr:hypothetical protein AYO40_03515 [Planctomycetaceae bacterium SCGC AG-212-D15]
MSLKIINRRKDVAKLVLTGMRYSEIAESLGIPLGTVYNDMTFIGAEWKEHYLKDVDGFKAKQIAKFDQLIGALWIAWEQSKTDEKPGGDHSFPDAIERCYEKQAKIMGLLAQNGVAMTVNNPVVVQTQDFFKKIQENADALRKQLPCKEVADDTGPHQAG